MEETKLFVILKQVVKIIYERVKSNKGIFIKISKPLESI